MQLNLTTWQRITLTQIIGGLQGTVATIRLAERLLDLLDLTPVEAQQIGLEVSERGLTWRVTNQTWPIEIANKEQINLLKQTVQNYQGWRPGQRQAREDLFRQLGLTDDE
jgi:hypothetical protein